MAVEVNRKKEQGARITVYSVVTARRSRPGVVRFPAVPHIMFTDEPDALSAPGWDIRLLRPSFTEPLTPQRQSRLPKILASHYLPDVEYSIYHDASFSLTMDPREIIKLLPADRDIAMFRHPARDCVYDEGALLIQEGIGTRAKIEAQIGRYRGMGLPAHWGLWACGIIVRRHTTYTTLLETQWWQEFRAGCERDQISFPFAAYVCGASIEPIEGNIYASPIARYHSHNWAAGNPYAGEAL